MFETINKIRIFLNLLLLFEILIGLLIILVTFHYQRKLSSFLTDEEGKVLSSRFFNVYILSFQLVASFLCGMSLWATIWPRRYSENIQLLLSMWLIFCFLIIACGCATIWTLLDSSDILREGAQMILLTGIDNYYMNPEWKLLWDKLQYTRECCGVHNYQDWMHASWMSENIDSEMHSCGQIHYPTATTTTTTTCPEYSDLVQSPQNYDLLPEPIKYNFGSLNPKQNVIAVVIFCLFSPQILAPYACCKRNSTLCYKNYMPHMKRSGEPTPLPHLNLSDINTEGCFYIFCKYLAAFFSILLILILLALFIDILICCITKYLMATNYRRSYREFQNDSCMFDDDGNALVVVKCPPKVRCIMIEEPNAFSGSDIPNVASSTELCSCCKDNDAAAD